MSKKKVTGTKGWNSFAFGWGVIWRYLVIENARLVKAKMGAMKEDMVQDYFRVDSRPVQVRGKKFMTSDDVRGVC